jgi:hypothetical protein
MTIGYTGSDKTSPRDPDVIHDFDRKSSGSSKGVF